MQTARTPFSFLFDILRQKKMVHLQINKLGHYNNKLIFFKVQQPLSQVFTTILESSSTKQNTFSFHIKHPGYLCLSQQAFEKEKSMHKWVISIKVLRAVWKVNTIVYSQLYLRQTTTNFQLIMDNIPVVVSNSCLKKKKKSRSWWVMQRNCRHCFWPVNKLKTNRKPIQTRKKILIKEYLLHKQVWCWLHKACAYTHSHSHTLNKHNFLPN